MIFWIWMATVLAVLVAYLRRVYSRFSKYGVKTLTPIPIFGTMGSVIFKRQHLADYFRSLYTHFPTERFVGSYEFITPVTIIHDLQLIKKITVKDFEHFIDHRITVKKETEPYLAGNLLALKGQEWKDMRSTLSPTFTSSKIRMMVPFMVEVGEETIKALQKKVDRSGVGYVEIDVKDLTSRYAVDVIASCAFGLKVDSHSDKQNEFYTQGTLASTFSFKQSLIVFAYRSMPTIMNALKVHVLPKPSRAFFRNLVLSTIQERESNHIIRPDMIHLLMEAKKGKLKHEVDHTDHGDTGFATVEESALGKTQVNRQLTDDDLIAQALVFFIAGFETISTTTTFLFHELAANPEAQEKLYQEIKENNDRNEGKIDYDSIQRLPYLDMCISEVMRLWPITALDRVCVKDYNLGKPNDKATEDFIIRKGEGIQIPTYTFHRNEEYFPNPNKFDPERFSEENRHNIKPYTYMPFGIGPRNCIGSRFALCEAKVMVYQLMLSMGFAPSEKTPIPIKLDTTTIRIRIDGGHQLRIIPRKPKTNS